MSIKGILTILGNWIVEFLMILVIPEVLVSVGGNKNS